MWFWLWLILSAFLLSFFVWTFFVALRRRKAWRVYAQKRKLRFAAGKLMDGPRLDGVLEGYTVGLFSADHIRGDERRSRKLTGIEVTLNSVPPFDGAFASAGMVDLVRELGFGGEIKPSGAGWQSSYIAITDHKDAMQSYLTDERLKALTDLMSIPNAWVILAARNGTFLLRVDTPKPLDHPKEIDALLKQMISACKLFEVSEGVRESD